jgi:hypothetical protein
MLFISKTSSLIYGKHLNQFDLEYALEFVLARESAKRIGIHALDNVIVERDITLRDNSTDPNTHRHCLDRKIDFGNLQLYAGINTTRLLTLYNGPFCAYLQWNHPRRTSSSTTFSPSSFSSFIEFSGDIASRSF